MGVGSASPELALRLQDSVGAKVNENFLWEVNESFLLVSALAHVAVDEAEAPEGTRRKDAAPDAFEAPEETR